MLTRLRSRDLRGLATTANTSVYVLGPASRVGADRSLNAGWRLAKDLAIEDRSDPRQLRLSFTEVEEEVRIYEYAVLVTSLEAGILTDKHSEAITSRPLLAGSPGPPDHARDRP
jgi:hypothetical protein